MYKGECLCNRLRSTAVNNPVVVVVIVLLLRSRRLWGSGGCWTVRPPVEKTSFRDSCRKMRQKPGDWSKAFSGEFLVRLLIRVLVKVAWWRFKAWTSAWDRCSVLGCTCIFIVPQRLTHVCDLQRWISILCYLLYKYLIRGEFCSLSIHTSLQDGAGYSQRIREEALECTHTKRHSKLRVKNCSI